MLSPVATCLKVILPDSSLSCMSSLSILNSSLSSTEPSSADLLHGRDCGNMGDERGEHAARRQQMPDTPPRTHLMFSVQPPSQLQNEGASSWPSFSPCFRLVTGGVGRRSLDSTSAYFGGE